ncbi:uncharacterized protein LOC116188894 [Punica granatum]|uniref:Transmembrane protein n=2 Tax=Punica granatum TaxID=22663 RepID=A0A218XZ83_PUNGR|nr:uncharacterized protein LOC116188894 [Punica granatum]OWM90323.1 hypothetical protein CDL15_Pgr014625 [Punica granatum]PKI70368.1 hypothetical protein CRG98_009248 [Punica granatum]
MAQENQSGHQKQWKVNWLVPVSAFMVLFAKIRAARHSNKLKTTLSGGSYTSRSLWSTGNKKAKKRKKGMSFLNQEGIDRVLEQEEQQQIKGEGEGMFGDGGVWQRSILMGGKCDPLNFSGVIYYDEKGRKLNQLPPRSPRSSPFPV